MDIAKSLIELFVGIAIFLVAMQFMSKNLKQIAGRKLKHIFKKVGNRFACLGIGIGTTCIVQSSAITGVMVIGFSDSKIINHSQSANIILGSFIGTTITGLIVSISLALNNVNSNGNINFILYLQCFSVIGCGLMMFAKSERFANIGKLFFFLGLVFIGLWLMTEAFSEDKFTSFFKDNLFTKITNPILLLLVGLVFTVVIQSSSATSGIVIAMASSGAFPTLNSTFYLLLGSTIGGIFPIILASIKSSYESKKVCIFVLAQRVITAFITTIVLWIIFQYNSSIGDYFKYVKSNLYKNIFSVSLFFVCYNIITIPISMLFVDISLDKIINHIFKDKSENKKKIHTKYINEYMIEIPTIALSQTKKQIIDMMELAIKNIKYCFSTLINHDYHNDKKIKLIEEEINNINDVITAFLIKLSPRTTKNKSKQIGTYFHVINDIERIGDHAYVLFNMANKMEELDLAFSIAARKESKEMLKNVINICELGLEIFKNNDYSKLEQLKKIKMLISNQRKTLIRSHYKRMSINKCKKELSTFYYELLVTFDRIGDYVINIGYSIDNPVGRIA